MVPLNTRQSGGEGLGLAVCGLARKCHGDAFGETELCQHAFGETELCQHAFGETELCQHAFGETELCQHAFGETELCQHAFGEMELCQHAFGETELCQHAFGDVSGSIDTCSCHTWLAHAAAMCASSAAATRGCETLRES